MSLIYQLLEWLAVLTLASGCILLHRRVRSASSLSLLIAIATGATWMTLGQWAFWQLAPRAPDPTTAKYLIVIARWQSAGDLIGAALAVWVSGSFFFTAKAVRPVNGDAA